MPDMTQALQDGFLRTDADVLELAAQRSSKWDAGTAAVVACQLLAPPCNASHRGFVRQIDNLRGGALEAKEHNRVRQRREPWQGLWALRWRPRPLSLARGRRRGWAATDLRCARDRRSAERRGAASQRRRRAVSRIRRAAQWWKAPKAGCRGAP